MNPLPVAIALIGRNRGVCFAFLALVALAVGIGGALTAQERALRHGSARAADRFDLIVAAPGSSTDLLLKVVYLQPGSVELLVGEPLRRLMAETRAEFVAPVGFGDSVDGDPVVGTIPALLDHLAGGSLAGRSFRSVREAVVGSASPLRIGETFHASHGHGEEAGNGDVHPQTLTVVGRLPPTGSPWDRAVLVPIEFVWEVHGLGDGHDAIPARRDWADDGPIGPPFDLATMPGIPAAVLKPRTVAEAYGLRNTWRTPQTMAFFPAEVLVQLYELLGDIRIVMSVLAVATELLLVAAILAGILIMMRLYRHRFAILRALGASRTYIFAVVWTFSFGLIAAGSILGLAVAAALCGIVSAIFENASGIALEARVGAPELMLAGAIAVLGGLAALLPAALLYGQPVARALRAA